MVIKQALTAGDRMQDEGNIPSAVAIVDKPSKIAKREKLHVVTQEIKLAQSLAGNDATLRNKVMKNLRTWLTTRSRSTFAFSDDDFMRLWKGLFYCMWMSDKPLVQEKLADDIGALVNCFDEVPLAIQLFEAALATIAQEWFGIDKWRMDKFMMLVRRCTRQILIVLHDHGWQEEHVRLLMDTVNRRVLDMECCPLSLATHFNDLILEEVGKVSEGDIPVEIVSLLLEPYVDRILTCNDNRLAQNINNTIFNGLLQQSELGQAYQEKFDIWKQHNFVTGNIDDVDINVQYEYDDDEGEEPEAEGEGSGKKVYDPRAGRVDVTISEIKFDPLKIVDMFKKYRYKPSVTSQGSKRLKVISKQFKTYATGVYPLGIQSMPSVDPKDFAVDIDEQVEDYESYRRELHGVKDKKRKRGKKKLKILEDGDKDEQNGKPNDAEVWMEEGNEGNEEKQNGEKTELASPVTANVREPKVKKSRKRKGVSQLEIKLAKLRAKKEIKLQTLKEKKMSEKSLMQEKVRANPDKSNAIINCTEAPKSSSSVPSSSPATSSSSTPPVTTPASGGTKNKQKPFAATIANDDWDEPLKDGEVEYFIPAKKAITAGKASRSSNSVTTPTPKLVKNPFATPNSEKLQKRARLMDTVKFHTPSAKRVKIALSRNQAQELNDHLQQVKNSPQLPFDSRKKPTKSLLKPNALPSPINPYYRKTLGFLSKSK